MATRGRLEAQITVPTGGWTVAAVGSSSDDATVAAGTYYLATLCTALASALSTATGDTVTVTVSDGESNSTGKVTIASDADIALTWTSTDLRDLLGYTGNLTADTSHVSTNAARMLWLPDCPKISPYGDEDAGTEQTNARATQNKGTVRVLYGDRWTEIAPGELMWRGVTHARCRIAGESVPNESFEKFWRDGILGEGPGGTPGGPLRLYWDADTDGTYTTYAVKGPLLESFRPTMLSEGLTVAWIIDMGALVAQ